MRIMKSKLMRFCTLLLAVALSSGCATTILTASGPVRTELVDGNRSVGEFVRNDYRVKRNSNKLFVFKTPLCNEVVEKLRVEQKPVLCWSCSMIELVFFGAGFFDLAQATAISEESRKEVKVAEYTTGRLLTCGELQPAPKQFNSRTHWTGFAQLK